MNPITLKQAIEGLPSPRVLIVGDLILDRYVTGDVDRISPEAPIPVLVGRHSHDRLGGAGNVAANLRAMDANVDIVGVVGADVLGRSMIEMLQKIGAETSGCVEDLARLTTHKTRIIGGSQQMVRVDWEDVKPVDADVLSRLLDGLHRRIKQSQAVVLSDYAKGVLQPEIITAVIQAARSAGIPVLVDPIGTEYERYRGATLVKPNRKEAEKVLGRDLSDPNDLANAANDLIRIADLQAAVITLGADGIYYLTAEGSSGRMPTVTRAVFDVTGAGDTVIAHLAFALAGRLDFELAVELANRAAGIVVGRPGAASVGRDEILAALGETGVVEGKILDTKEVESVVATWRAQAKRIVFTNGCFDILHAGHVEYLRFAKSKGDVLLVGLNDDESVRRLKGPTRPVNTISDRMAIMAALEMVDAVVPFSEDTPKRIVERVTPDVLIKGEDWADKGVVGREWVEQHGGQVVLVPLMPGRSTTAILERGSASPD